MSKFIERNTHLPFDSLDDSRTECARGEEAKQRSSSALLRRRVPKQRLEAALAKRRSRRERRCFRRARCDPAAGARGVFDAGCFIAPELQVGRFA